MSRATTKQELIVSANENFAKMWRMIDDMPVDMQNAKFNFGVEMGKEAHWGRDKNTRDILVHLYEWHELMLDFVQKNQSGENRPFLPAPYTWKTYGEMNIEFWNKHQKTSYADAKKMVKNSHEKVMKFIENFSDGELFEKKHFDWTGTTSLGAYFISATASHYDWAMKKLKAHSKTYNLV